MVNEDRGVRNFTERQGVKKQEKIFKDRDERDIKSISLAINNRFIANYPDIIEYMKYDKRIKYINPQLFEVAYQYYKTVNELNIDDLNKFLDDNDLFNDLLKSVNKSNYKIAKIRSITTVIRYYKMIDGYSKYI